MKSHPDRVSRRAPGRLVACCRLAAVFAAFMVLVPRPVAAQIDQPVADEPGQVVVVLNDGRQFQGTLVSQDDLEVIISIASIQTRFKAENVANVIMLKSFEEHYRDLKANIPRTDYQQRLVFCKWIYQRHRLEIAAAELEDLLDDEPTFQEARELLRKINAEIELLNRERQADQENQPVAGNDSQPTNAGPELAARLTPTNLLTDDQVNLIRVYEIDLKQPPRLLVRRDTIQRLFDQYGENDLLPRTPEGRRAYFRREPIEIVSDMFQLQARDLYPEVRVLSEPTAMNKFRLNVHRVWLMNSCATTRCHGGTQAGTFFLFNRNTTGMNTVYTNFLILERTTIDAQPMLNYKRPERSPLLQLGLPRNRSLMPHPDVDGWRPVFRDEADPLFTRAIEWMGLMYQPRPDYPIQYRPPFVRYDLKRPEADSQKPGQDSSDDPADAPARPGSDGGDGRR